MPCALSSSFHVPSTVSRLPAAKLMPLRSGRKPGSAITCLPFWYLKIVSDGCGAASSST